MVHIKCEFLPYNFLHYLQSSPILKLLYIYIYIMNTKLRKSGNSASTNNTIWKHISKKFKTS